MLDDFAQLLANVSVLSKFKVGWAKPWCSQVRCSNVFSTYMALSGHNPMVSEGRTLLLDSASPKEPSDWQHEHTKVPLRL